MHKPIEVYPDEDGDIEIRCYHCGEAVDPVDPSGHEDCLEESDTYGLPVSVESGDVDSNNYRGR